MQPSCIPMSTVTYAYIIENSLAALLSSFIMPHNNTTACSNPATAKHMPALHKLFNTCHLLTAAETTLSMCVQSRCAFLAALRMHRWRHDPPGFAQGSPAGYHAQLPCCPSSQQHSTPAHSSSQSGVPVTGRRMLPKSQPTATFKSRDTCIACSMACQPADCCVHASWHCMGETAWHGG